jgi:ribose transport system substrate-binding protein
MKNRPSRRPRAAKLVMTSIVAVGAFTAVACGSSTNKTSSSNTATSGTGATSAGAATVDAAKAKQIVEQYLQRPTSISFEIPVGKPIPSGKTLDFIPCGTETCELQADLTQQAADILGWKFTKLSNDGSPQQIQNAWIQITREKPDAVIYTATPRSQIDTYITQAAANGTLIAAASIAEPGGNGIIWEDSTPAQVGQLGQIMAAWAVNQAVMDGNRKPATVYLDLPDFPILTSLATEFKKSYAQMCPGCAQGKLDFGLSDLQGAPDKVVSYIRSNPDTKYVVESADSPFLGLPAALKAAGLNNIKILGEGPSTANLQAVVNGDETATMAFAWYEVYFGAVDAIARKMVGVPVIEGFQPPNWILTKDNIPTTKTLFPLVPDTVDHFKKLWGKA